MDLDWGEYVSESMDMIRYTWFSCNLISKSDDNVPILDIRCLCYWYQPYTFRKEVRWTVDRGNTLI